MSDTVVSTVPSARSGNTGDAFARERRFFLILSIACVLAVFAGFSPSYYLKDVIHAPPALSTMTRVHGVVFTAWVLLFLVQVTLINRGSAALHRRIGLVGAMLFGSVLAIGVMTAINAARLGHAPPLVGAPIVFLAVPLSGIAAVAMLVFAALWNRAKRDAHMRYMMSSFIAMTPPATHRIIFGATQSGYALPISHAIMDALLLFAIFYDYRTRKSVHPAYLWAALVFAAANGFTLWAYKSPTWIAMAHWIVQT